MQDYKRKEYKVFELFDKKWALVTAGNIQHYNCCTVSWGSLGNIWGTAGNSRSTVTVYVHPARYTSEVLKESDIFTVSFYPETSRKALGYLGSHSGRDENKIEAVGFTPVKMGQGVTFEEAECTFLCKKLYQHHTGYIGNLKEVKYGTLMAEKSDFAMELAIKGMLPDSTLGRKQLTRCRIFKGADHKHEAQKPEAWNK